MEEVGGYPVQLVRLQVEVLQLAKAVRRRLADSSISLLSRDRQSLNLIQRLESHL